jgi:hypothetical protein
MYRYKDYQCLGLRTNHAAAIELKRHIYIYIYIYVYIYSKLPRLVFLMIDEKVCAHYQLKTKLHHHLVLCKGFCVLVPLTLRRLISSSCWLWCYTSPKTIIAKFNLDFKFIHTSRPKETATITFYLKQKSYTSKGA